VKTGFDKKVKPPQIDQDLEKALLKPPKLDQDSEKTHENDLSLQSSNDENASAFKFLLSEWVRIDQELHATFGKSLLEFIEKACTGKQDQKKKHKKGKLNTESNKDHKKEGDATPSGIIASWMELLQAVGATGDASVIKQLQVDLENQEPFLTSMIDILQHQFRNSGILKRELYGPTLKIGGPVCIGRNNRDL
jgi:hypothetical protein